MPNISFPDRSTPDADRLGVTFPADIDGHRIVCFISAEALQDHFGARGTGGGELTRAFERNRSTIEAAARRKILFAGTAFATGRVDLLTADF